MHGSVDTTARRAPKAEGGGELSRDRAFVKWHRSTLDGRGAPRWDARVHDEYALVAVTRGALR